MTLPTRWRRETPAYLEPSFCLHCFQEEPCECVTHDEEHDANLALAAPWHQPFEDCWLCSDVWEEFFGDVERTGLRALADAAVRMFR